MKTQNMKLVVLVVFLAVCVGMCYADLASSASSTVNSAKGAAAPTVNAAKDAAAPTVNAAAPAANAAADKSESFASWAYHKVSSGLGFKPAQEPASAAQGAH